MNAEEMVASLRQAFGVSQQGRRRLVQQLQDDRRLLGQAHGGHYALSCRIARLLARIAIYWSCVCLCYRFRWRAFLLYVNSFDVQIRAKHYGYLIRMPVWIAMSIAGRRPPRAVGDWSEGSAPSALRGRQPAA